MVRRVVLFLAVVVVALVGYRAVQAAAPSTIASIDIDSSGRDDAVIFRPSEGKWYVLQAPYSSAFAISSASAVANLETLLPPGDYNGDGKTDIGTYRGVTLGSGAPAGVWTIGLGPTFNTATALSWGVAGDTPLPADWDGDGRLDVAVFRPSEGKLYVLQGGSNFTAAFTLTWGAAGDIPIPADLDNDGRTDFGVYRRSESRIYVLQGGTGFKSAFIITTLGLPTDNYVPGDYDGDGKTDLAAYTPTTLGPAALAGTWTIAQGGNNFTSQFSKSWGVAGDVPAPGDFDGDGRLDIAVFRPSEGRFFVLQGGTNYTSAFVIIWGANGDIPIGVRNPVRATTF